MHYPCRHCHQPLPAGAWRCPHCGAPMPAGGTPSAWRFWSGNRMARQLLLIFTAVLLTVWVISMSFDDMKHLLGQRAQARNNAADSRELLLREQQRLNTPDGSENLDGPMPSAATALAPARNAKTLIEGMRTILSEVGDRARYRQAQAEARIQALHLENQLLPETLLGARATRDGRQANREYIALLNYSLAIKQASHADLARRMRALAGEGPKGRAIMAEFAANLARESEEDAALMTNRRATIAKVEQVFNLADAQRKRIDLDDDGTLVFADAQAAMEYNRLRAEIDALAAQRDRIEVQRQARMQAVLTEIQKIRR